MSKYEYDRLNDILTKELIRVNSLITAYIEDPSSDYAFDNLNDAAQTLTRAAGRVPTLQEMAHKLRGIQL